MTKFSFEVPIYHMNDFEDLQDFHFSLSFLFQKTLEYRRFFERQISKGLKTVWLDNSFNEKQKADDAAGMGRLARMLGCQKVIAPDNPSWSNEQTFQEWFKLSMFIPSRNIIVVAPDESIIQHGETYGITSYAIPYESRYPAMPWMSPYHFLGMISVKELQLHIPPSCDTGMPIKMAKEGITLSEWESLGCPHYNNYDKKYQGFFDWKLTTKEIDLARENIKDLKEAVNG